MTPIEVILVAIGLILCAAIQITNSIDECPSSEDIGMCLSDLHMQKDDLERGRVFGGQSKTPPEEIPKYCRYIPSSFSCLRKKIATCPPESRAKWTHYLDIDGVQKTMLYMCENYEVWSMVQKNCTASPEYTTLKRACTREQILYAQLDMVSRGVMFLSDHRAERCSNKRIDLYCDIQALNVTSCALEDHHFCAGLVNSMLRIDTDCTCEKTMDKGYCPPTIDFRNTCNIPDFVAPTFNPTTTTSKGVEYSVIKPVEKDKVVKSEQTNDNPYNSAMSLHCVLSSQILLIVFILLLKTFSKC